MTLEDLRVQQKHRDARALLVIADLRCTISQAATETLSRLGADSWHEGGDS